MLVGWWASTRRANPLWEKCQRAECELNPLPQERPIHNLPVIPLPSIPLPKPLVSYLGISNLRISPLPSTPECPIMSTEAILQATDESAQHQLAPKTSHPDTPGCHCRPDSAPPTDSPSLNPEPQQRTTNPAPSSPADEGLPKNERPTGAPHSDGAVAPTGRQPCCPRQAARHFYERHKEQMDAGASVLWPQVEDLYTLMCLRAESGRPAFEREKQNSPLNHAPHEFRNVPPAWVPLIAQSSQLKPPVDSQHSVPLQCGLACGRLWERRQGAR